MGMNFKEDEKVAVKLFTFLSEHYPIEKSFSKEELENSVRIKGSTFKTYFGKKVNPLLIEDPNKKGIYIVSNVFKKYNRIDLFKKYFSQSEKLIDYYEEIYSNIVTFEFFLPLNNESALMSTLDELFYKDTIKKMISLEKRDAWSSGGIGPPDSYSL